MKIDLHLHTSSSSNNGDSIKWIGNKNVLKKIFQYNYKVISFTDHNVFDWKQYIELKKYSGNEILILPGIEINIITIRGAIGNLLAIFKDNLDEEKLKKISKICRNKLKKSGITHKEVMELFNEFETIIIPHVGKSDYLEVEDLKLINYDAIEVTNFKHPNFKKFQKSGILTSIVAFSDTHIWTSFPQHDKLFTNIEMSDPSFDNLKKKLNKNKKYAKEKYV